MKSALNSVFQTCSDTSDAVELFGPQQLYLKPVARLNISVQLPQLKIPGKTISNWEVMEKIKSMVKPTHFTVLKVSKSTLEFIRFEGEIENKSNLSGVVARIDGRTIKLSGFSELLKIRAAEAKMSFPTRHTWDSYFRDAKNMNEMKPGERPDTIHLSNLPCKWFSSKYDSNRGDDKPSEYVFRKVFEQLGDVRCVDIPILDPYRSQMKAHISGLKTFSFGQDLAFEGYVQFKEYVCFVKAMDALRGMKLLHKEGDKAFTASIKVDFDRTKHLSENSIHRRRVEREKLMAKEREIEERERKAREIAEKEAAELRKQKEAKEKEEEQAAEDKKKRKAEKQLARQQRRLRREEAERMNYKIAVEERKLLIAQRKLESIRLLDVLFDRVKAARQKDLNKEKDTQNLEDKERELRLKLMKKYKSIQELQLKGQQEKLRRTIEGKNKIRSVLSSQVSGSPDSNSESSTSSDSDTSIKKTLNSSPGTDKKNMGYNPIVDPMAVPPIDLYAGLVAYGLDSRFAGRFPYSSDNPYFGRGRPPTRNYGRSRGRYHFRPENHYGGRGHSNRAFNNIHNSMYYNSMDEYYKYFRKLAGRRSRSPSRSRSRSRRKSPRSHSRTRRRSRSRDTSRRRSRSRSNHRSGSRSNHRSRSRSNHRSRSLQKKEPTFRDSRSSRSRSDHRKPRSRSSRSRKYSRSRSPEPHKDRERSHLRSLSKDLSLSLSPSPIRLKNSEDNGEEKSRNEQKDGKDASKSKRKKKKKSKTKERKKEVDSK